jgi:hypothetical protein
LSKDFKLPKDPARFSLEVGSGFNFKVGQELGLSVVLNSKVLDFRV